MELKPGYKQTDVGAIPQNWEVNTLSQLGTVVRGGSPRPAGDPRYFNGNYISWLTVAALTNISDSELYVTETAGHLTEEGSKHSRTLDKDTLIIANSGATLGVAKILSLRCCANDGIAALIDQRKGDKRYLCHYINSQTRQLREIIATGNGQPNLNIGLIGNIAVPFPSDAEQRAIAAALGDADDLIRALDRLIAKKRDLKQAAMQQLLTGKTRLPEFSRQWHVRRFSDLALLRRERVDPRKNGVHYFCVELEHIEQETGRLLGGTTAEEQLSLKSIFREGDVLFGKLRAYLRKYWLADQEGVCSTEIWVFAPNLRIVTSEFLFQLVKVDQFIETANTAYGTHMPRSDWNVVKNYEVRTPPLAEQIAIATVLSNMDAEIAALEQRRDKTRDIKLGMMQELLTGRTRLISEPRSGR
jgi:type I restriction enzyme S subunit